MTDSGLRPLETSRCWELLEKHDLGRLAIAADGGAELFPVNYIVRDRAILLRSGPGSKMFELTRHPDVAFEIDGRDHGVAWSVVVHGDARRMSLDDDIVGSGIRDMQAMHPGAKFNYVRITPKVVSGRAFPFARTSAGAIVIAVLLGMSVTALVALSLWLGR